ncbi:unnamed protein product [Allacma fusca]|uniref:ABC transporter TMD0 domain-containing protein n=1 Tax=Allacma fusca TaxID=39272 RepID=A0A8J2KY90_9HEXA|nr:unnamed protein product [Allacma fusca]
MNSFCGSPFWDSNITWNTDSPRFTPCFEKTVLVWIPSIFLTLFSSILIYSTMKRQQEKVNISCLGILQGIVTSALGILQIINFSFITFRKISNPNIKSYQVDQAKSAILAFTFTLALILQFITKRKGISSSAVLFIFWLLATICSLPEFLNAFRGVFWRLPADEQYNVQKVDTFATLVGYPVIVAGFILSFFADQSIVYPVQPNKSHTRTTGLESKPCPQKSSSFPNQITFQWAYPLLRKGYKSVLKCSDLWDLNEEDKSSDITNRFMKHWKPELERAKKWYFLTCNTVVV